MIIKVKEVKPRDESIKIELSLPIDTPKKYRKLIDKLMDFKVNSDDSLDIDYRLGITYYGQVEDRFKLILQLAKAGYLKKADFTCLNHKICLIQEIIREIDGMCKEDAGEHKKE